MTSSGRLRSRYARSAIRETLGSAGGPQSKSVVMDSPLRVCRSHSTNWQCCGLHPALLNMPQGSTSATLQGGSAAIVAAARRCCCSMQAAAVCAISDLAPAAQRCMLGTFNTLFAPVNTQLVMLPQATTTLTDELLEAAAMNTAAVAGGNGAAKKPKQNFMSI